MNLHISRLVTTKSRPLPTLRMAGPARGPHWLNADRLRLYPLVVLGCYVLFAVLYLVRLTGRSDMNPFVMDFLPSWSAATLALHGHAADAYNVHALSLIEIAAQPRFATANGILPWLYPPNTLLLVLPLALLPYTAAAVLWLGGAYVLFVRMIRTIVAERQAMLPALFFPGAIFVVSVGQNGLLTAALAGYGLIALRRHPVVAGVCLGLLCMKPQLALLFPLALLCSRSWRALAALVLTAASTLALALLVFGTGTLSAFLHNTGIATHSIESAHATLARVPTIFALATLLHAPAWLAYAGQGACALAAAAAVGYAWGRECSYSLRAATLICASLLVSPYLYDYDLAWYGVLIAWYCRHALNEGWGRGEREWLVVLWVAPLSGMLIIACGPFQFMPLISLATLWMLLRRIARERRAAPVLRRSGE
ncbi:glycosyltransferase family 87 protein [Paraburkholderia ginsengiterrae]|uniref:glycosyltransferase family 87 protein n=1 Tax=Paraburkholderia ginsengiterrae TaxID=1462993 RepID=UPI000AD74C1B|nr:glycosyltransferase family 87 protein [Paraburkholderia ginsengiterrae]